MDSNLHLNMKAFTTFLFTLVSFSANASCTSLEGSFFKHRELTVVDIGSGTQRAHEVSIPSLEHDSNQDHNMAIEKAGIDTAISEAPASRVSLEKVIMEKTPAS